MDARLPEVPFHRVIRYVGGGGMGDVYEARRNGMRLAIKVIAARCADSEEFLARFEREAELSRQLDHPAVLRVVGQGVTGDGRPYIAFPFVEGPNLTREAPLHPRAVMDIVGTIAGALDAVHGAGFVHRDVKPANILVDDQGRAFLSDFGIARPFSGERFTAAGLWMGSAGYGAPEQGQDRVDARVDIYGLAATAFHLLSGGEPFPMADAMAKRHAHAGAARPRLPGRLGHAAQLDAVIARGMAIEPAQRYLSAGGFARALAAAAEGRTAPLPDRMEATGLAAFPAPPQPAPAPRRARGRAGRRTAALVAGLLGGALLGGAMPAALGAGVLESAVSEERADDLRIEMDAETKWPERIAAWRPLQAPTLAAAVSSLGAPDRTAPDDGGATCRLSWRDSGLTVTFGSAGADPCADDARLLRARISFRGPHRRRWRTFKGLRLGVPEGDVRRIYPLAHKRSSRTWWIIFHRSGSVDSQILSAVVGRGWRISALTVTVPPAPSAPPA